VNSNASTYTETLDVKGGHLVAKVKELIHEGNVRRIIINDADGKQVLDMPVSVGVIGLLVAPTMTAIGTLGALAADYSIQVEREVAEGNEHSAGGRYRHLLDNYVEWYKAGDLDAIMSLYAEDAVQGMPEGTFTGRRAIRERLAKELVAFSDIDWGYVSYIEQGDAFADEWYFAGTHTGPFELPDGTELPPTGKRVELHGMELVVLRDGEIVVDNLYYDNLTIAVQLGLLPESVSTTV
jgi:predicted ester cyclase